jgi:hypothetical protein
MGEDAKKARLLKVSKTPKPPHPDGGRPPSIE